MPHLTTGQRGYGLAHKREREKWRPIVERGEAVCCEATCLETTRAIHPGTAWDLAHTPDRTAYLGPAHARCNRAEGGTRSRSNTSQRINVTTLRW